MRTQVPAAVLLVLLSCQASCATAIALATYNGQQVASCAGVDRLALDEVAERLSFIEQELRQSRSNTRFWFSSWLVLLGGASAGQTTLFLVLKDRDLKIDAIIGAAGTLVAMAPLIFTPRHALTAYDAFRKDRASDMPPRQRLCRAEILMDNAAHDAAGGASWFAHVSGDAASVAIGMIQWLAFGHRLSGLLTAVGGSLGNEALVLSQPTGAVTAYNRYREQFNHGTSISSPRWSLAAGPLSVQLRLDF